MRKVKPPTIKWVYVDSEESERRRKQAFNRIFQIAKQNIIERRKRELANKGTKSKDKESI